jgi:quinol monooxygenase YgiN
MKVKVVAQFCVKSDQVKSFLENVNKLIAETHKEAGCLSYQLYKDMAAANQYAFLEEWESPAALEAHMHTPHFTTLVPVLAGFTSRPVVVSQYALVE